MTLIVAGCYRVRPVPVRQMDEYPCREKINDLSVAAEVFAGRQCAEVFNHDLSEKGFLPVLLLVRNEGTAPVTVNGGDVCLRDSAGHVSRRVPAKVVASRYERNAGAEAFLFFGLLSFMDAQEFNDKMHADWQEKEFASRLIVQPKSSSYGFVYFQAGKKRCREPVSIVVPVICGSEEYKEVIVSLHADGRR